VEHEDFFDRLLNEWEHYEKKGKKTIKNTKTVLTQKNEEATHFIKKYPYIAILLAFLIGYFIKRRK